MKRLIATRKARRAGYAQRDPGQPFPRSLRRRSEEIPLADRKRHRIVFLCSNYIYDEHKHWLYEPALAFLRSVYPQHEIIFLNANIRRHPKATPHWLNAAVIIHDAYGYIDNFVFSWMRLWYTQHVPVLRLDGLPRALTLSRLYGAVRVCPYCYVKNAVTYTREEWQTKQDDEAFVALVQQAHTDGIYVDDLLSGVDQPA